MTASHDHVHHVTPLAERQASLDELFHAKGTKPIESAEDLACDGVFESDEELEEFLAFTYAARRADLA
jgi:heterodisulfide reductase subunit B